MTPTKRHPTNPVHVSLREFIASGRFGPVRLGIRREDLEAALGPPDAVGGTSRRRRVPAIWNYGTFLGLLLIGREDEVHRRDLSGAAAESIIPRLAPRVVDLAARGFGWLVVGLLSALRPGRGRG